MDMKKIDEMKAVIQSLSRKRKPTEQEAQTLANARLDLARELGIEVSDCDLDILSSYTWKVKDGKVRTRSKGADLYLGKLVMQRVLGCEPDGPVIQTQDASSTLDYRRDVLKVGKQGQNYSNELKRVEKVDVPTQYMGLYWHEESQSWYANLKVNHSGTYRINWFNGAKQRGVGGVPKPGTHSCPHYLYYALCRGYGARTEYYARQPASAPSPTLEMRSALIVSMHEWDRMCETLTHNRNTRDRGVEVHAGDELMMSPFIVPGWVLERLKQRGRHKADADERVHEHEADQSQRWFEERLADPSFIGAMAYCHPAGKAPWEKPEPDWMRGWKREIYTRDPGHSNDIRRRGYSHNRYHNQLRVFWRVLELRVQRASLAYGQNPTAENHTAMQEVIDMFDAGCVHLEGDTSTQELFDAWYDTVPPITDEEWATAKKRDADYIESKNPKPKKLTKEQLRDQRRDELVGMGIDPDDASQLEENGINPETLEPDYDYDAQERAIRSEAGGGESFSIDEPDWDEA